MEPQNSIATGSAETRAPGIGALSARDVIERADELLGILYRGADLGNVTDVLAEAVYILITKQTREAVYQRVYRSLLDRYRSWLEVADAPIEDLEEILRPAGLQTQRARDLKFMLAKVRLDNDARGVGPAAGVDLTLEYLRDEPEIVAEGYLKSLPGLWTKCARCVTLYALGRADFPVDTHVARIFDRLGLVPMDGWKPDHDAYQEVVPPRIRGRFHVNLVHHGRAVCRTSNPRCGECPLVSFCESGRARLAAEPRGMLGVELCAGAGGMGLGFSQAGFVLAAAVEIDRHAAQTYRLNHPGVPVAEADVTAISGEDLAQFAPALRSGVAVTVAGPPCQGYSAAGPRDPHAERNYIYEHIIRLAKQLKSRSVVIENVPGLAKVGGVAFTDSIERELEEAGYVAETHLLEAPDFGVPQRRKRYFFMAVERELDSRPAAPEPTHRHPGTDGDLPETPTLVRLLAQLPSRAHGILEDRVALADGTIVFNAATMRHSGAVVEKISKIVPGQGPFSYRRLDPVLATTIVAGHRALPVHPAIDRTISVREAALIQGFPLSYVFCGSRSDQPLQVANAVPPPLARAVARQMISLLRAADSAARRRKPPRDREARVVGRGKEALQPLRVAAVIEDQVAAVP